MRASGFGVMPKVRAGRPTRSAMRVALSRSLVSEQRKFERRHAQPGLGRGDQRRASAALPLEPDGDVDAGRASKASARSAE